MDTSTSRACDVVAACFASKSASALVELLGFNANGTRVPDLDCDFHGSRGPLACYVFHAEEQWCAADLARSARAARAFNHAQLQLYIFTCASFAEIVVGSYGLGEHLLTLRLQHERVHAADLEALEEMVPQQGEAGTALAARHGRALDRTRVTKRFFADFAAQRDRVSAAWSGPAPGQRRDRDQLALLLLSRMMFLYFLQHRSHMAGDRSFLLRRFRHWQSAPKRGRTFYNAVLKPLFFFVLNRRAERRPARAQTFGDLPYLNGGLFERHVLERKHSRLDLPDTCIASVFDDLLERYRFTAHEPSESELTGVHDVGVDPEMLGRVFEGLMASRTRQTTGTFYTPAATVDRLVCDSLCAYLSPRIGDATARDLAQNGKSHNLDVDQRQFTARLLREVKVLDPACGSGAFLLGSLTRIAEARSTLEDVDVLRARRDAVARNLYGVDLQADAAQLCALRLWLSLVPDSATRSVQPLPNLDRQIRQGDSLVDPIDLRSGAHDREIRNCIAGLAPAAAQYVSSEPEQRSALQRTLTSAENRLAKAWVNALLRRLKHQANETRAIAAQKDLFGERTAEARAADEQLASIRQRGGELRRVAVRVKRQSEHPFFSFGVHFAEAALTGFDIVVCNPPWVRSHNWSASISALVRRRFDVCRQQSWRPPHDGAVSAAGGHQVDLALLFLERALELLAPGGVLGIILPAKFLRSLSGAAARRILLEHMQIVSVEDHSLDQNSIFEAAAFATLIVARKAAPRASDAVSVTMVRRNAPSQDFTLPQCELSLFSGDRAAPWLLVPPDVRRALGRMRAHPLLGDDRSLLIRRGIVTGANSVLVLTDAKPKLGGLVQIRAEGYESAAQPADFDAVVEEAAVAPLLRGCDVRAWTRRSERFVLCRRPRSLHVPRTLKYLARHNCTLPQAADLPASSLLAWHDLASTLNAVVVPGSVVPLNTVYFVALDDENAHLLCAYFNSLPVRTFARAIAERAKDAHFRFFAWTMSLVPLPSHWRTFETERLRELSRQAHASGAASAEAQSEVDAIVARAYGLTRPDVRALAGFDKWLRGS